MDGPSTIPPFQRTNAPAAAKTGAYAAMRGTSARGRETAAPARERGVRRRSAGWAVRGRSMISLGPCPCPRGETRGSARTGLSVDQQRVVHPVCWARARDLPHGSLRRDEQDPDDVGLTEEETRCAELRGSRVSQQGQCPSLARSLRGRVPRPGKRRETHESRADPSPLECAGPAQEDRDDGGEVGVVEPGPVSYTHLTLPTIYSV